MLPGEKAKLVNLLDNIQAEKASLTPIYSIELVITVSPKTRTKCGAIAIFKLNDLDVDLSEQTPTNLKEKMQEAAKDSTQILHKDPEYFKETEGRWLPWAIERTLELYDSLGSAEIVIKVPKLRVRHRLSSSEINKKRSDPRALFDTAFRADDLFTREYSFDPWRVSIRRGNIGATE